MSASALGLIIYKKKMDHRSTRANSGNKTIQLKMLKSVPMIFNIIYFFLLEAKTVVYKFDLETGLKMIEFNPWE